ncbi:MAG: bile acid:sodium symporter family protein [Myxococcales bacterium]|nr:bile acid:sodium symporter family protein [Myxococcales bacterium]
MQRSPAMLCGPSILARADLGGIDAVTLEFSPTSLQLLNAIIGLIMFGIALDLRVEDFRRVFTRPRPAFVVLTTQIVLLPALTFALVWILRPPASVALGMMLVAACPGGNVSNLLTHMSRGNTELSVTMTAVTTAGAIVFTPLNLAFWASLDPGTAALLQEIRLDPLDVLSKIVVVLLLPLALGMIVAARAPTIAARLRRPFRRASMVFLALFIVAAAVRNLAAFLHYLPVILPLVALHNGLALGLGYTVARLARLNARDRRTATIEVGIQNAGLGLVLIFAFFDGLGGMAYITSVWGGWHLIAGFALMSYWSRREPA